MTRVMGFGWAPRSDILQSAFGEISGVEFGHRAAVHPITVDQHAAIRAAAKAIARQLRKRVSEPLMRLFMAAEG